MNQAAISSVLKLPRELWEMIIDSISRWSYLECARYPHDIIHCEKPSFGTLAGENLEQTISIKQLACLTRVCKDFYFVCNPILWSHVRIAAVREPRKVDAKTFGAQVTNILKFLDNLIATLQNRVDLATEVTHLTVQLLFQASMGAAVDQILVRMARIMKLMPNMRTLVCPRSCL